RLDIAVALRVGSAEVGREAAGAIFATRAVRRSVDRGARRLRCPGVRARRGLLHGQRLARTDCVPTPADSVWPRGRAAVDAAFAACARVAGRSRSECADTPGHA